MDERENVEVLFLGNITHQNQQQTQATQKSNYQDQISFADPVQIELIRIPSNGKQMYSRLASLTQKQPIKSLEIYYRNLDKKVARYSLLVCSSSELLVSSSIDILMTLPETIFTDLLVIRGNFTNITFCIYGRVLRSRQEIQKKCPYFINNIEVPLREEQPSIKIHRNVFNQSRTIVKAIEDQYSEAKDEIKVYNWDAYSNDRELYDSQITNICKLSQQLSVFDDLNHIQQRSFAQIRSKMQSMLSYLSKLFKSAHIGLYYPTPYRPSAIPGAIPTSIVKLSIKLLTQSLSDQYRTLEVLKLILQLGPHAQKFVKQGGIDALVRLFLQFFSSNLVILSSLKSLVLEVFIVLSFWDFAANKLVDKLHVSIEENISKSSLLIQRQSQLQEDSSQKKQSKQKSRSRSRQKKKKRSQVSPSRSSDRKKGKKQKKSKKNRQKSKQREKQKQKQKQKQKKKDKNRSNSREKIKKQSEKQKEKEKEKEKQKIQKVKKQQKMQVEQKNEPVQFNIKQKIAQCNSFYQMIFVFIRYQKNNKLQQLMRIFISQITQTLTKNIQVSNQMAHYTALLRDTKYMFNQGGQMINSKTLKTFASFQPFLNQQQSRGVDSPYICERQKIKQPNKYGISPKLFKLIDSAISIFQSKSQDEAPVMFDQQFMTLISALIANNKNGIAIGLNYFIEAIKIDTLLALKKQQAVVAIICEYLHEVFIEDEGMNLIYYLDQIHNSMLKIINWLKQDKTFSLQIKRKVQYLINSALIYNHFSGTQNNFKSFSEYFIKLIGHENFDIHKILDYRRKEYHKTVNPLNYSNLSDNFSLGNFHEVLPAQPLLQVDICLRMFLAILKLNKNIWTVFYQYKFVPAFATLYLKIHSLLKFFLTPSLERQNAIIDIKMHQRLMNNYLQVAKHLTTIFIYKWRYESAFNQLTEQQDIFDSVQLYEKWIDTYLFLYNSLNSQDSFISEQKTFSRLKQLFANFAELFDVIFKGYQLIKHVDRQRNIKAMIKYIYRLHYQTVTYRAGIFSILRLFISIAGPNTYEVIVGYLFDKNPRNSKDSQDILLPDNQKSIFQNIFRRNVYRSDCLIVQNLSGFIQQIIKQQNSFDGKSSSNNTNNNNNSGSNSNIANPSIHVKDKVYELIQTILDENEAHLKQFLQLQLQPHDKTLMTILEKNILLVSLLSYIQAPMNLKIQQHLLRLLKQSLSMKASLKYKSIFVNSFSQMDSGSQCSNFEKFQVKKLKIRNSYLNFFKSALEHNTHFSNQIFQQFIKTISNLLHSQLISNSSTSTNKQIKLQQLKSILLILSCLISASSYINLQSIILFGQYIQKPSRPACQINLQKVFLYFRQHKNKQKMNDEQQEYLIRQIGVSVFYFLCRMTSIDGIQFYSTQCRKNALNLLVSPQKLFNLQDVIQQMQYIVPRNFIETLKNYLDFPIIQKPQTLSSAADRSINSHQIQKKTIGSLYSKGVFTMISQNDPVGKTRFQLIQQNWQGGDTQGTIYKVNTPLDYKNIVQQKICIKNLEVIYNNVGHQFFLQYQGIHESKEVNSLFHFKIRKVFTQDIKKNALSVNRSILMKNIPNQIKRPQITPKQAYLNKLNNSPSLNRNMTPPGPALNPAINNPNNGNNRPTYNPAQSTQPISNPNMMPANSNTSMNMNMNTSVNANPNMNMGGNANINNNNIVRASSSNNREPSPYSANKPSYVPPNKVNYPNTSQPNFLPPMPATPVSNPPGYYPPKNINYPPAVSAPINKPYNTPGYDQPIQQPNMYDPRLYYQQTPNYDPRNPVAYHPGYGIPPQSGYQPRVVQPPIGYPPNPSPYAPNNSYQPARTGQSQIKQVQQQMSSQAISILLYLQQNPNVPDKQQLKSKVNKLFQAPGVHDRVTRYFQQLKRN